MLVLGGLLRRPKIWDNLEDFGKIRDSKISETFARADLACGSIYYMIYFSLIIRVVIRNDG